MMKCRDRLQIKSEILPSPPEERFVNHFTGFGHPWKDKAESRNKEGITLYVTRGP